MHRDSGDQSPNNWRCLWESNRKSRLQAARGWLQRLSSSSSSPRPLSIPPSKPDSLGAITMSSIPMNKSPEDQFLNWRQDMKRKKEEQARQMKDFQGHVECLQREND